MYKVEIPGDSIQEAAIQRRRRLDEERKKIIFNPRVRILGVDLKTLDEQIQVKKEIKVSEKSRELDFDKSMKRTNQILELLDDQIAHDRQQNRYELEAYRKTFQRTQERRDFDLYDPNALKKDLPARVNDNDERCGISGMQRFEGEDLAFKKRLQLQREQMKTWTLEQSYEKEQKAQRLLEENKNYDAFQKNVNDKMLALEKAVVDARKEQARFDRDYNRFLAEEKRRRELEAKEKETEQNIKEMLSNATGIFLTESPDVFNIGGGHKVRVDLFKGMTKDQKDHIRQVQHQQRLEAEQRREKERERERQWAIQEASNTRLLTLIEREKERQVREEAIQLRKQNQIKAKEDKTRQSYIDNVLYTNPPSDAYFSQFNTTCR